MASEEWKMAGESEQVQAGRGGRFLGSLRDALAAAGREDVPPPRASRVPVVEAAVEAANVAAEPAHAGVAQASALAAQAPQAASAAQAAASAADLDARPVPAVAGHAAKAEPPPLPSAAEVAREARAAQTRTAVVRSPSPADRHVEFDSPPTTRVIRPAKPPAVAAADAEDDAPARTQLVRGHAKVVREGFQQDPVVGWLVIVGGPGLGMFRPIFEGNNTIGRSSSQRVPIDFGDTSISSEEQGYIRYDSVDRSFLFVPNLAKTNVVRVNQTKPTGAVPLSAMDVITMGHTQLVFVPFCGPEFDWSEISEAKS